MVAAADGEAWSDWNFISEQELWQSVLGRVFCIPDACCSARWVGLSWMVLTSLPSSTACCVLFDSVMVLSWTVQSCGSGQCDILLSANASAETMELFVKGTGMLICWPGRSVLQVDMVHKWLWG